MNLRRLDLNLLVIFDALMAERNVTRAARRVNLSQPAVSNALSRLRHYLKDELFVRGPKGMRPTPRAVELAGEVRDALRAIENALDPVSFDPKTARRTFLIDTTDLFVASCVPALIGYLEREAPGIDLRFVPAAGRVFERLDAREVEFGIGAYGEVAERFGTTTLGQHEFVVVMRPDHPLAKGRFDLTRYAAAKHVVVSLRGDASSWVDTALADHGLSRRVALTVNNFSVAPTVVARSNLIATLPHRIADLYAPLLGLTVRAAPFAAPFEYRIMQLIWLKRFAVHPAHDWFRQTVEQAICSCQPRPLKAKSARARDAVAA